MAQQYTDEQLQAILERYSDPCFTAFICLIPDNVRLPLASALEALKQVILYVQDPEVALQSWVPYYQYVLSSYGAYIAVLDQTVSELASSFTQYGAVFDQFKDCPGVNKVVDLIDQKMDPYIEELERLRYKYNWVLQELDKYLPDTGELDRIRQVLEATIYALRIGCTAMQAILPNPNLPSLGLP